MLGTYETVLAIFSVATVVLLGPLIIGLVIAAWRRRAKYRNHAYLKRELAKLDLDVQGFKVKVHLARGEVVLTSHPEPHMDHKIGVKSGTFDDDIGPTFDSAFSVHAAKQVRANLRSDPSRLIPLFDFLMAWSKELEVDYINQAGVWLKFRGGNKDPSYMPVDLLPDLLPDASVAFRAFYQAANTSSSTCNKKETAFPAWLFHFRFIIKNRFYALLLGLVAAMISGGLLTNQFHSTMKDREAMSWPSVEGKMITSKVIHRTSTTGHGSDRKTNHSYHAELAYRYTVNKKTYTRHRYSFFRDKIGGEIDSYDVTTDYPKDSKVRVYYNPREPGTSIIRRYGKKPQVLYLILWTLAYLPSLLILAFYWLIGSIVHGAHRRLQERGKREKPVSQKDQKDQKDQNWSPNQSKGADKKRKESPQTTNKSDPDSESDSAAPMARELIKKLKQEGSYKGKGEFTLERGEARKQLGRYQLADPHEFVLELVQAAVLKGSTFVNVKVRAHAVELRFDGRPFGLEDLDTLYDMDPSTASTNADLRARHQLALGLVATERLGPHRLQLRSGDEAGGSELNRQPDQPDQVSTLDSVSVKKLHPATTTLHFQFSRRRESGSLRPVADHLRRACLYAEIPIRLNGDQISEGLHVQRTLAAVAITTLQAPGLRGELGFTPLGEGATVHVVQNGVLVSTLPLGDKKKNKKKKKDQGQVPELVAVVRAENLRLDLSRRQFVRNEALIAAQEAVLQARDGAQSEHDVPALLSAAQEPIVAEAFKRYKRKQRWLLASGAVPFLCGIACAILGEFNRLIAPDHDTRILLIIFLWVVGLPSFIATVALPWFLIQRGYGNSDKRVPPKSAAGRKLNRQINKSLDD